jgi:UDP-N-acetylmuramate--alanine ligase
METKCHFIGIGGIGMSALARILLEQKTIVSGSDIAKSYLTEDLSKAGAKVFIGHDAKYITPDLTVIYSTDIKHDNPEFAAAYQMRCQILHRSDLLQSLMKGHKELLVAGSHGKTTTTGLLTSVLIKSSLNPSYAVGGILKENNGNAKLGKGEYFVAEADESDGTFLKYSPYGAIVTNIGSDHLDYYGTKERLLDFFKRFCLKVHSDRHLFWCKDNKYLKQIQPHGISYGFCEDCDLRAINFNQVGWKFHMDVHFDGKVYPRVECNLVGAHNALNALAVFGMALQIGVKEEDIRKGLTEYQGVKRRLDRIGERNGVLFIDDYAHHPNEIASTLHGLRLCVKDRRILAVYQPHRFSRIRDCLGSFGGVFDDADVTFVTDIYSQGEKSIENLSATKIVEEVQEANNLTLCKYLPFEELEAEIVQTMKPEDVVLFMGAGNLSIFARELVAKLPL